MVSADVIEACVTEYFADDIELPADVASWSEEKLRSWLDNGGVDTTVEPEVEAEAVASDVVVTKVADEPPKGGEASVSASVWYEVVFSPLIYVRVEPETTAAKLGLLQCGQRVETVGRSGDWVQLTSGGWVLTDGRSLGLGALLQPASPPPEAAATPLSGGALGGLREVFARAIALSESGSSSGGPPLPTPVDPTQLPLLAEHWRAGRRPPARDVAVLLSAAHAHLAAMPTVIDLDVPRDTTLTVVGDIHGQYDDLLTLFAVNGFPSETCPCTRMCRSRLAQPSGRHTSCTRRAHLHTQRCKWSAAARAHSSRGCVATRQPLWASSPRS
jgi:hypothetical protein